MTRKTPGASLHLQLISVVLWILACTIRPSVTLAQGTKQWTTDRYDEFQRGTMNGVAIRDDGRLEMGMAVSALYAVPDGYVWSIAQGGNGVLYAGLGGDKGGSAAVVRLGADGNPQRIFTNKELGVQSVKIGSDGSLFVATSPDGRVYRLATDGSNERVVFDPQSTSEKSRYIWDLAVAQNGTLYVATGSPAAVYRVSTTAAAKPELLFKTADMHIRCLLLAESGVLWAGSDGTGVIYRFATQDAHAKPIAAYAAEHREITSLAIDRSGAVYAAAVGAKGPSSLPPLPVTGGVGVSVTILQPGSTGNAGANGVVQDGSEVDRIAPDGTPQRLCSFKEDVVYALTAHEGQVLAATGNRGKIYRLDPQIPGRITEVARVEAGQATTMAFGTAGVLIGSSNGGKVLRLLDQSSKAVYTSEVFDAGQFSRWGRAEVRSGSNNFELFARTGNVPNTMQGWSDWRPVSANTNRSALEPGRYAQWQAELHAGAAIDAVTMNYLPRNVAPVLDDVVVAIGARIPSNPVPQQPTVQVVLPSAGGQVLTLVQQDTATAPLVAQKDRNGVVIRWAAHDDNGDDLMFAVWYRGVGETTWRLLKDKLSERFLSFDAALLPDGHYEVKVIASDGPVHVDADTLTGERLSATFTIDTTPPIPGALTARMEDGRVHWSFEARDTTSPIAHAEASIDAGPWQYVEPVGGLSDSLEERYDVRSVLPTTDDAQTGPSVKAAEHVLAVRVYDRAENMTSAKTVVR